MSCYFIFIVLYICKNKNADPQSPIYFYFVLFPLLFKFTNLKKKCISFII